MRIKSNKESIADFFNLNSTNLEKNYPGCNLHILEKFIAENFSTDNFLSLAEDITLKNIYEKLLKGIPFAQISGKYFFYNSWLYINEHVLIPRFESEILVAEAVTYIQKNKFSKFAEIGVGSGALSLAIAKECSSIKEIIMTDISDEAIKIAMKNFELHRYQLSEIMLKFIQTDRLKTVDQKFDLIISNPPYIKAGEDRSTVHVQVLDHEPHIALFLEDNIYDLWFKELFLQVKLLLNSQGLFLMEGHEDHLKRLQNMASEIGFESEMIEDLTSRDRILRLINKE